MKIRVLLLTALGSVLAMPALRAADESAPPPKHKEEQTELGEHMEKIGGAFRRLGRQITDASKNEDSLKLVATIRMNAEAAAKLKPAKTADLAPDKQDKFVADYQEDMKKFLGDVDKLEAALKAGNNAEAAEIAKAMKKDSDDSHKEFQKKKPRPPRKQPPKPEGEQQ